MEYKLVIKEVTVDGEKQYKEYLCLENSESIELKLFSVTNAFRKACDKFGEYSDAFSMEELIGEFYSNINAIYFYTDTSIECALDLFDTLKYEIPPYINQLELDKFKSWANLNLERTHIDWVLDLILKPTEKGRATSKIKNSPQDKFKELFYRGTDDLKSLLPFISLDENYHLFSDEYNKAIQCIETYFKRLRDYEVIPIVSKNKEVSFISSRGLIPLVWAEINYAIMNNIYAQKCAICSEWFKSLGRLSDTYCEKVECKKEGKKRAPSSSSEAVMQRKKKQQI